MKTFLDVGAHTGETLQAALDSAYAFDRIVCFEPVEACCRARARVRDSRVVVLQAGLWKETVEQPIVEALRFKCCNLIVDPTRDRARFCLLQRDDV